MTFESKLRSLTNPHQQASYLQRFFPEIVALVEAVKEFRDNGTILTACNRGPCQRVIEHEDKTDPQEKMFAALAALDKEKDSHDHS